jgi:hypothetical protein
LELADFSRSGGGRNGDGKNGNELLSNQEGGLEEIKRLVIQNGEWETERMTDLKELKKHMYGFN